MSTVRKILSARAARPKVEGMLQALVEAAVFIGGSDGRFDEDELDVFIDSMREVVSAAVGDEFLESMAATHKLLDQARAARRLLREQGTDTFLHQLAPKFAGPFGRDGLVLAWRVVLADGRVTDTEAAAFETLARALDIDVDETRVLRELASKSEAASKRGHRGANVEHLRVLEEKGWQRLIGGADSGFDAGLSHTQSDGGKLLLELDAGESVLHLHVLSAEGEGPHLRCLFEDSLPALLAVLDGLRDTLKPSTMGEKLPALRAVCPEMFVQHEGKFSRL
jgi:tellurite resistance protein